MGVTLNENKGLIRTILVLGSIVTALGSVITAWLFLDTRFAHAGDVARSQNKLAVQIQENYINMRQYVNKKDLTALRRKKDSNQGRLESYEEESYQQLLEQQKYFRQERDALRRLKAKIK